jgi:hypothetical protein
MRRTRAALRSFLPLAGAVCTVWACTPQLKAVEPSNEIVREEASMESAKRRVPKVEPVTAGKTRYEALRAARARGFNQNGGVIVAIDTKTSKELWTLQVYETHYDPNEEADVQDVFIIKLKLADKGKTLIVEDENGKTYSVDTEKHRVLEQVPAGAAG